MSSRTKSSPGSAESAISQMLRMPRLASLARNPLIGAKNLLVGKRSHNARHKRHGRGFAHDAREFAFFVDVVAAAGWRHALARNSQFAQCARIQPQGMGIAGIQGDGAAGEGGVKRGFAWQHGRVPSVLAPPFAPKSQPWGLRLARGASRATQSASDSPKKHFGQRARVQCRMECVHMCIMEACAQECVAKIFHVRGGGR